MKRLFTDRRLFIGFIALIAMVYKPEIAAYASAIALAIAGANSAQAIFTPPQKEPQP